VSQGSQRCGRKKYTKCILLTYKRNRWWYYRTESFGTIEIDWYDILLQRFNVMTVCIWLSCNLETTTPMCNTIYERFWTCIYIYYRGPSKVYPSYSRQELKIKSLSVQLEIAPISIIGWNLTCLYLSKIVPIDMSKLVVTWVGLLSRKLLLEESNSNLNIENTVHNAKAI